MIRRLWETALQRALYQWSGRRALAMMLALCAVMAALFALWVVVVMSRAMPAPQQEAIFSGQLVEIVLSYTVLFFLFNTGAAMLYVTLVAGALCWMGRWGYMPRRLGFSLAWRLAFISGVVPLVVVLMFGQALGVTLTAALLLMAAHIFWLRTLELPARNH